MLKVFIGYDPRQPVSYNVLQQSIMRNSTKPVSITGLVLEQLPLKRTGLTPFTYTRFLVPYLCNYEGWGLFLDSDMLVEGDIAELFSYQDDRYSVMVSKNKHKFEWASVILYNCSKCKILTPEYIETAQKLHTMDWLLEGQIGNLPPEWNHLVGYDTPRENPKLVHFTQGNPCFPETIDSEHSEKWHAEHQFSNSAYPWIELMGPSVHAVKLQDGSVVPRYKVSPPQSKR